MWISWISNSFKGEIRVHLCISVFNQCNDYQMSVCDLFYSKNRDLSKSDHVCGSESCHEQMTLLKTSEKELMLLIRLEKFTKPSLKSLDSTNPQSDKLCTNGGNSRPLLHSWELVDQQRSLQSRMCNSPMVTSKQLKAFLTLANVNVHEPTIRRTLSNYGVHGRVARRKPLFSKNKIAC